MDQDQRRTYDTPELQKIGNVNELTKGGTDPTSGERFVVPGQ